MSRILRNVHKSASRLHETGFVDDVTMREFDALCLPPLRDYTPEDIKKIRKANNVSQAVFAQFINVKTITVSAWEQGTKKPNSTAIKLLDLVERKGLDVLQ
jgi:putative transcriptional regulator